MVVMKTAWVIGAGGLGQTIAKALHEEMFQTTIISRSLSQHNSCDVTNYDCSNEADVQLLFETLKIPNLIIVATGLLHDINHQPEKSIKTFKPEWFMESITANCLPAVLVAKHLSMKMNKGDDIKFVALSGRVASISDNKLGGWHSYRASKAALNMIIKNISIEWKFSHPNATIVAYHPGTVDTKLSVPFQKNVPNNKLFTPEAGAAYCLEQIHKITPKNSGQLGMGVLFLFSK